MALATESRQSVLPQRQSTPAVADRDVADLPGGAQRAAQDLAARDDARADPGGDLDEQQVVGLAGVDRAMLADGDHVHVVVEEDRAREALLDDRRDRHAGPVGHDAGALGAAGRELHGRGHAQADAADL
nr:hypothetical protein GCM10020093_005110 [Planobispora longispora]